MNAKELLKKFTFTPASKEDILNIMKEPQLIKLWAPSGTLTELAGVVYKTHYDCQVVRYGRYKLLLELNSISPDLCGIHIACPKDSIVASRILAMAGTAYALLIAYPTHRVITTSCPEGKIANMIRKIGAKQVSPSGSKSIQFIATRETFNLIN
jgi:hypothetical protein